MKKFPALVSTLLHNRTHSLLLIGVLSLQGAATYLHVPGWQCPILSATGIPCPGCGLSRATTLLLRGDWQEALHLHAFAPLFLFGCLVLVLVAFLPEYIRHYVIKKLEMIEIKTGISLVMLVGLFVYWGIRLLVFPVEFTGLIRNS